MQLLSLFFFLPRLPATDCNNHGSTLCFFLNPLLLFFSFLLTEHHSLFRRTPKWKRKNSRSHFIYCCSVPKHISPLKHLDIFVVEHFFPLMVQCACQTDFVHVRTCVCVCVERYRVCVLCTCLIPFVRECDVQSSKLKQRGDWAIDGSMN